MFPLGKNLKARASQPFPLPVQQCLGTKRDGRSFSRRLNGKTSSGFQKLT